MKTIATTLCALAVVAGCATTGPAPASAPAAAPGGKRPNFVVILTDDQRWDALGAMGGGYIPTPHIDRIGKEGVRFTNAFVTTPLCSPSRASFLTGRYVHAHGVKGNGDRIAREPGRRLVTFARDLKDAGYRTAFMGKWHMGSHEDAPRPEFDRWVSFPGQGDYVDPTFNIDGQTVKQTGYMTDLLTDQAVAFLDKAPGPFLLYLSHKAPHDPFTPAPRHKDALAGVTVPRHPCLEDTLEGKVALRHKFRARIARGGQTPPRDDERIRNYLRVLLAVDDSTGRVFEALERRGVLNDTVVVYVSDNGFFYDEHGGLRGKHWGYEESIRIPFLVRYPALARAGSTVPALVLNLDLAPTLLSLAGLPVPASMHGKSLLPLFKAPGAPWRDAIMAEFFAERDGSPPDYRVLRTDRWKYIQYVPNDFHPGQPPSEEVYDLAADPYELRNLAAAGGTPPPVTPELRAALAKILAETGGAPLPGPTATAPSP